VPDSRSVVWAVVPAPLAAGATDSLAAGGVGGGGSGLGSGALERAPSEAKGQNKNKLAATFGSSQIKEGVGCHDSGHEIY